MSKVVPSRNHISYLDGGDIFENVCWFISMSIFIWKMAWQCVYIKDGVVRDGVCTCHTMCWVRFLRVGFGGCLSLIHVNDVSIL